MKYSPGTDYSYKSENCTPQTTYFYAITHINYTTQVMYRKSTIFFLARTAKICFICLCVYQRQLEFENYLYNLKKENSDLYTSAILVVSCSCINPQVLDRKHQDRR